MIIISLFWDSSALLYFYIIDDLNYFASLCAYVRGEEKETFLCPAFIHSAWPSAAAHFCMKRLKIGYFETFSNWEIYSSNRQTI